MRRISTKVTSMDVVCNFDFEIELGKIQSCLYSFVRSIIYNYEDAKDVLQDTNLILCEKQNLFDPNKAELKTWAFKIARYQVMGFLTKKKRNKIYFDSELIQDIMDESITYKPHKHEKEALDISYQNLPEHMKEIANLRFKKNYSMKKISKTLNKPIGSISATLFRIRENLLKSTKAKISYYEVYGEFKNE